MRGSSSGSAPERLLIQLINTGGLRNLPTPAVGWPAFLALGVVYFAMNYLLLGSIFLMIGAQASTVREVQTLSMPATFAQVIVFGFAATAVGQPNSTEALIAAVFPLSSPLACSLVRRRTRVVAARRGSRVAGAVGGFILRLGAKLFRKTVLKSGPRAKWWKVSRA